MKLTIEIKTHEPEKTLRNTERRTKLTDEMVRGLLQTPLLRPDDDSLRELFENGEPRI